MRKSTRAALAAILTAAITIRLSPLWSFLYWGSDTGEYLAILRNLVRTGHISTAYLGWGFTYPYFPGMFFPQAALVDPVLGGFDAPTVVSLLVPVLGALAVLPMFLLAVRVVKEDRLALFAAAFLAGANPHAYTTAHSAPATFADLLVFANLLLFLRLRTDGRAFGPLLLVSGALIVSHHLSLYFFLLMALGGLVIRGLLSPWTPNAAARREIAFVGVLIPLTFAYWFGYATTFQSILGDVNLRPGWLLFAAFGFALATAAGLIAARRRIAWRYRPRYPGFRPMAAAWAAGAFAFLVIGAVTVWVSVPGTTVRIPPDNLVYFVPLVVLISLSAAGRKVFDFERDGFGVTTWLVALLLSAGIGIAIAPHVIIPYRHLEYLLIPFAIFAAVGFFRLLDTAGIRGGKRRVALALGGALLVANCLTGIPPPSSFADWREGTIPAAIDPAYWARDHASGLFVADHHASTTLFGFGGLNATWDRAVSPFVLATPGDPYAALRSIPSPSGTADATYVWIDRDMQAGVRLHPWDPALPMDPMVLAKFDSSPFIKVFDNGYARLYWIAWGCDAAC
jgi:hypothetical protein